jgi:hypothetical protein
VRSLLLASLTGLLLAGCSGPLPAIDAGVDPIDSGSPMVDAGAPDAGQPDAGPPVCGAATITSSCGDSALVRGVAHFDPARVPDGGVPVLRLALRHSFVLLGGEEQIGGRLHANISVPVTDVASGSVPFAIDMCLYGTAMWSEENGAFHLIGILDLNGNNDLDQAQSNDEAIAMGHADYYEPAGMLDLSISCHQPSPCVSLPLDCIDGTNCTLVTPLNACTKTTPSCPSDDSFCQ